MRWIRATEFWLVMMLCSIAAFGQVTTTTVADMVYHADGTKAGGMVIVSWPAFTTAAGQAVPGGSTSVAIGGDGTLSLQLAPNVGATPAGTYYTAVYHLDDGTVSREYWSVPVSATSVTLGAVRSTVLPATVAVQTASKSYVDSVVAAALAGTPVTGNVSFLNRIGDTMVGPLALAGDPTTSVQAANKHYVDAAVASVGSGLAGKVGVTPLSSQAVTQPAGTELQVNRINGVSFPMQFSALPGNNGIANAVASPACAGGCQMTVEQEYNSGETVDASQLSSSPMNGTHVEDLRGGGRHETFVNPMNRMEAGHDTGVTLDVVSTRSAQSVNQVTTSQSPSSIGLEVTHEGMTGGSNQFPATIPGNNGPFFKSNYNAVSVVGKYNTQGQHVLDSHEIRCYGVGDCLIGSQFITASGGFRDEADEGTHPMDIQIREDNVVFTGSCASGCTTGSNTIGVAIATAPGTQGDGRYLINRNPAKTISNGTLLAGNPLPGFIGPNATFAGTAFPVSVFLQTTQVAPASAHSMAPGTVTLGIATSGLAAPFSTTTTALPTTSGVACVTDAPSGFNPTNWEMAQYTVVDASHLSLTLGKVHGPQSTIAVGGLCGYGIEQTVDTVNGIRQVFPVIGSTNATTLFYAGNITPIVGRTGSTSSFVSVALPISGVSRSGGVTTVTTAAGMPVDLNGLTLTIAGVADASFNGQFVVTTTGANTFTYANAGATNTSSGGTASALTGGYVLYPMAEVLSVLNPQTKKIDGVLTLAANTVPWAAGDPVEEPHYFEEAVMADTQFVGQSVPRATVQTRAGVQYESNVGPGLHGWSVLNAAAASNYFGNGGTRGAPDAALEVNGVWTQTMEAQAGESGVFRLHCNSHGCGRWNSVYNLFQLDSAAGYDFISYQPRDSSLAMNLRGATYAFTTQGFTAGGSVTAAALHGSLDAGDVATGKLSAARLPVFGASGTAHAIGAVPDPGTTTGSTRFLREDGTWAQAPGSSGSTNGTTSITGGSIDGTTIGQTTPSSGRFSQLSVTGCDWFLSGTNQGVGTCTPTSWNAVNGVSGSNLQIYGAGSSRLIVTSQGNSGTLAEFHFVNLAAPSGSRNWRMSNDTSGRYTLDMNNDNYSTQTVAMQCLPNGSCRFPNGVTASNFNGVLSGTTGSIGGAALGAGSCTSGTVAVAGAAVGTPVVVSASDGSLPNGLTTLSAAVSAANTVTVQVCAVGAVTPKAVTYNVRVVQ